VRIEGRDSIKYITSETQLTGWATNNTVTYKKHIGGFTLSKALVEELRSAFEGIGRRIALCSSNNLSEVSVMLEARYSAGEISAAVFEKYLEQFSYFPPASLPGAEAVLLTAVPIGRSVLELTLEGGSFEAIVPPTYGADEQISETEALLSRVLGAVGIGYDRARVPLKILAAQTGLGCYGRDNILRFEGLGSFVRLDAWWTELSAEGEAWGPPRQLERCASCGACERACPNGCISGERFIIDASRCLTFMNEGTAPFPSWVHPDIHNAAVGCLRCQEACPENRNTLGRNVYRRFVLDREASALILEGKPIAALPPEAQAAVRAAEMAGSEANLARNLRALAAARGLTLSPARV
jgi:epoxyqueuosine reductase